VAGTSKSELFAVPPPEPSNRGRILGAAIAIALIALIAAAFLLRGSKSAVPAAQNTVLPPDSYARNLVFSQLAMSQSTSLSGGTSTFIDGRVKNTGAETVTSVTMQVLFRNDLGLSPQVETLPLTLIRTHEPYVDTEPVSAAPLKPGDEAEFRLIIETVNGNWNQALPELLAVKVARR
jgi:hypothetical protein